MSISGLLLGLINIAIVVAVLILVGYVILWLMGMLGFPIRERMKLQGWLD